MQEILSNTQIEQKVNRLAHQLHENCFEEKEIYLGGIQGNGFIIAQQIKEVLVANSDIKVILFEIKINKKNPWDGPITLSTPKEEMENGYIVLVDDVLNSGKTVQYALVEILQFPTKAIKILALVDRKHRRFPIKADFVGLSLSTTLKEHVEVDLTKENKKAYLV